jgi:hypothetical protein
MSTRTSMREILKTISEPVREKFPEMANSVGKLSEDKEFQSIVSHMGTIGGLINLGTYLYSKIKEDLKSDEEKYFAALMTLMFRSAKESLRSHTQVLEVKQVRNDEYIKELFVLFIKKHSLEL